MDKQKKIEDLLKKYKILVDKLNQINDQMNEVGTDSEDMIPGHDDGAEWYAKFEKYNTVMEQVKMIKTELRELGYKYAL